jgi:hypothetical protein
MRIAVFSSLEEALIFQKEIVSLVRHPTSPDDLEVSTIYKYNNENKWWINYDDVLQNGGTAKSVIQNKASSLQLLEVKDDKDFEDKGIRPKPTRQQELKSGVGLPNLKVPSKTVRDFNKLTIVRGNN